MLSKLYRTCPLLARWNADLADLVVTEFLLNFQKPSFTMGKPTATPNYPLTRPSAFAALANLRDESLDSGGVL